MSVKQIAKKPAKRKRVPRRKSAFSPGELNRLIDGFCHPLAKTDQRLFLLDGFLHGLIERDPPETVRKFIKYNFPQIMKKLGGKR